MARQTITRMINGQAAGVFDSFVAAVVASKERRATHELCDQLLATSEELREQLAAAVLKVHGGVETLQAEVCHFAFLPLILEPILTVSYFRRQSLGVDF
jgi:hypothetical protein